MRKHYATLALFLGMTVFGSTQALAHYPWINAESYFPHAGESPKINIGYGHGYPLGSFLQQEDLESMSLTGPTGQIPLKEANIIEYEPEEALSEPGIYTVAAQRKAIFYTKTTDGWKRQTKEGLKNVLRCSLSHKSAKGLLTVDAEDATMDKKALGHVLEIVPQANPASLRAGDYLPVQLLLRGKPHQAKLFATYMGFSTESDVFAYTTKTDKEGMGRIRILQPGIWLIKAEYEEPYSDQKVCDVEAFSATLTLEVR
ncbi:MAG: DUF4198 domain-containing protein [Candidatus Electrothrix aestuarii]|uniref:DUF4198 domain-containing protein n=1 Tax=Candidatus Electrothrix aestuarii TaxID=3062594 RepID=A0AAU8LYL6_9BACT|nr:DUF4198 domain-containing protein [Candidatus Electrothrix aestuarii]